MGQERPLSELIAEEDAGGQPKRRYLHGPQGPISMTVGGQDHYYHRDALGSITDLTAADGHPERSYTYEPYGDQRTTQQLDPLAPANPIRYAGQRLDENSGLYHLRARDLDPNDGRLTAPDPLAPALERPFISPYAYADNQPTALTDPSGLTVTPAPGFPSILPNIPGAGAAAHPNTTDPGPPVASPDFDEGYTPGGDPVLGEAFEECIPGIGGNTRGSEGVPADEDRDWSHDKKLGPAEIEALKAAGLDTHDIKELSGTDLFKDRNGDVYEKPSDGAGPGEPTGININEVTGRRPPSS